MTEDSTRINKYLALHGGYSRREADALVEQGRVTVNGQVAQLGGRVQPDDAIEVDGKPFETTSQRTYLAFHKPVGYVCSRRDQGDASTIYSLLPEDLHSLKTVGRLDKNSSGIIILTDDGDFAHRMTHPKFHKQKIYRVKLDQPLQPLHRQMISDFGVMLEDGKSQFEVERIDEDDDKSWQLLLQEGRNRQIRRTFAALGYTVEQLHRDKFGPYALDGLVAGKIRIIKP